MISKPRQLFRSNSHIVTAPWAVLNAAHRHATHSGATLLLGLESKPPNDQAKLTGRRRRLIGAGGIISARRRRGIGRALVSAFESGVADRGGLTITLGTDDDSGMTSLAGIDLYTNLPVHIAELRDLGRGHPFGFYRRLGFVVTGVMPDANGRGFPDIYMSKPVK